METEIQSPFRVNGKAILMIEPKKVTYRGMEIEAIRSFYKDIDTGLEFSTSEQDSDFMWEVFRKYCELKGFDSFEDILPPNRKPTGDAKKMLNATGSWLCYGLILGFILGGLLVYILSFV